LIRNTGKYEGVNDEKEKKKSKRGSVRSKLSGKGSLRG
jgi:hypothetical protein